MARKLIKIAYLGTNYCGWQVQPNGISVQTTLQDGLEKVLKHRPNVCGCSRTDSGVHAREFFCHFDTEMNIPDSGIVMGLNTFLPNDISALECKTVADDFHARYNAKGKTYNYEIYFDRIPNPFLEGRALRLKNEPDLKRAEEFCSLMLGEHDFASFSSANRTVEDTVRCVTACSVKKNGNRWIFSVTANGFLYNMVRIMAGSMLFYAEGKITKSDVLKAFEKEQRNLLGNTLPPFGLYLNKVHY